VFLPNHVIQGKLSRFRYLLR